VHCLRRLAPGTSICAQCGVEPGSEKPKETEGSEPDEGPRLSTPVVLSLLSLAGVLGASLLTNWDKLFRSPARPAAVVAPTPATTGAQSPSFGGVSGPVTINYGTVPATTASAPIPDRLQGVWLSASSQHPYQTGQRFQLRLELQTSGSEWSGQVSDVPEGRSSGPVFHLQALKAAGEGLDFQVESTWCCEGGQPRPYQTFYQLRPAAQGLTLTRRNNSPGGGQLERFELSRAP